MKLLGIDLSSKTGWAVADWSNDQIQLLAYGAIPKSYEPELPFPDNYISWALTIAGQIIEKIEEFRPDVLVIEHTAKGSKNFLSQKLLEWANLYLAQYIVKNKLKYHYFMTGEWRSIAGCSMTKAEKKNNEKVKKQHNSGIKVAKNELGKRIGKIGKKHVNVRRANELFGLGLIRKDEDVADAILLTYAYFKQFSLKKGV